MQSVPVFLISFNRGEMLERTINSIQRMAQPTKIIVHDNGSTDPITLGVLEKLSHNDVKIVYHKAIHSPEELNSVDETVQEFFSENPASHYIVSDCDIDIGVADPRAFALYAELLRLFPDAECVGPMLRIRDIPSTYPLFSRVMNRHIDQFWKLRPSWVKTSLGQVAYIAAPIDTTMALHRNGKPFSRLKQGIRVYEPYEARHLDWYIGAGDTIYTKTSDVNISHWDNLVERERHRNAPLEYYSFYAIRSGGDGLEEYIEHLAPTLQQE